MATISKFNRPEGDPVETKEETTVAEPKKEIPKATYNIMPPRFQPKPQLTPEEELTEATKIIEEGKANNRHSVIIPFDLKDLAWQKLSQQGYKLTRRVLDRIGEYDYANVGEKDPNRIEFEVNLNEFNRTDI